MSIFCLISMKVSSIPFLVIVSSAKTGAPFQASNWFLCGREKIRRRKLSRRIFSHEFSVTNNGTVFSPLQKVVGLALFPFFSMLFVLWFNFIQKYPNICVQFEVPKASFFSDFSLKTPYSHITIYNVSDNYFASIFGFDVNKMRKP